jgi:glucose/arabinose dehydrogenase
MSTHDKRTRRWPGALAVALLVAVLVLGLTAARTPAVTASDLAAPAAATGAPTAAAAPAAAPAPTAKLSANASVFATGLDNPRGLKFGPDGALYVAEAGAGGTQTTVGKCDQVVAPIGPYTGSPTGSRISRIDAKGTRTTFAEGFPSSMTTPETGGSVSGVADVAFISNTLYAVTAGAGCSHGVAGTPNGIFRIGPTGKITQTADLSQFQKTHPTAVINPPDFEPDGTWYSLAAVNGNLYAVEPNHGELDSITPAGIVTRLADISDSQGHIVPTAMAYHDGSFYVGNLGEFPAEQHSKILRIDQYGNVHFVAGELTTVLGVAFDQAGQLYALETSAPVTSTTPGPPVIPGTGRVVRLDKTGAWQPVATGLTTPTGMTFGPDGYLYVSNFGFGAPPQGLGQIVRIDVTKAP